MFSYYYVNSCGVSKSKLPTEAPCVTVAFVWCNNGTKLNQDKNSITSAVTCGDYNESCCRMGDVV